VSEKHVTEQQWLPDLREDGVYLVAADDRSVVLKLCRPDRGSDLLVAGYVAGLQAGKLSPRGK
jgi:Ser/Thr protein kinase RdoA (MazF antagonist)